MTIWQHSCDDVNLTHDQMIELHKDGFLKLSILPSLETQIERLAKKYFKKITSGYELTSRHVIAFGVLGVSVYFGINDSFGWLVLGLVAAVIIVLGKSGNTEKLIDLAMRDAEFFNRVRDVKGWIFHIEEDKEKEYLVHQAGKEVHDENKKPKYNFVREIKYKKYWYGLDERGSTKELMKIFKNLGYKIELSRTSNEKELDLILDKKIVVRKNTKGKKVRGLELQEFWESWKDTHNSGIFISINGFNSNCKYFAVGKQILLYELEDLVKIVDGKNPEIEMLYIFEQERKEIEKEKNAKRNAEFQSETSVKKTETIANPIVKVTAPDNLIDRYNNALKNSEGSLRIVIPVTNRNADKSIKSVFIEWEDGIDTFSDTFTRKELITLRAIKHKNIREIYVRNIDFESEVGSETAKKPTGADRLEKAMKMRKDDNWDHPGSIYVADVPLKKGNKATDYKATDFLIDEDELAVAKKATGISRLKKALKMYKLKKASKATDFLDDDDDVIEYVNAKKFTSNPVKAFPVVRVEQDIRAQDFLSDD